MMNVKVKVYDGFKYDESSKKVAEVEYSNVVSYEILTGERAIQFGETTDEASRDEFNEYLVLHFADGEIAGFCNSHVDMFRL